MRLPKQTLAVMVALILACPLSATSTVVGVAGAASQAMAGGIALVPGATIFSGDLISVGEKGRAQIVFQGAGMLAVEENSAVRVHRGETWYEMELLRGKLRYRMPVGKAELKIANLRIVNAGTKDATLAVVLQTPTSGTIASLSGELRIYAGNGGKVVNLSEGKGVPVSVATAPQAPAGAGSSGLTRGQTLIVGAIIVAIITALALGLNAIENNPPRPIVVSPAVP